KEHKAAFVLRGKVSVKDISGDIPTIGIIVLTEATDDYPEKEEAFAVCIHPQTVFEGGYNSFAGFEEIEEGHGIEASGYLRTKEPEDEFGRASSDIRPYAMRIKKLNNGAAPKEEAAL
ncbi:MAG TPA: hypothetical protein DHV16_01245, partial [Nitrospiraceae bacterium]|nr:hypothetical protein [Nitrospiraceae bacterium]